MFESSPSYQKFLGQVDKLFVPKTLPEWSPETEHQLIETRLPNGVLVDFDLDYRPEMNFLYKGIYPEGIHTQPANHFIEHMLVYPRGIGELVSKLKGTPISYDGKTSNNDTIFSLMIQKLQLPSLLKTNPEIHSGMIHLLYGMSVEPEITEEHLIEQKNRMSQEFKANEIKPERRLHDYIIPLLVGGRPFCVPTPYQQVNFSAQELKEIHKRRPHGSINLEFSGNPYLDQESAIGKIMTAVESTFGQLPAFESSESPKHQLVPLTNDQFIRVIPDKELSADLLVLTMLQTKVENPKQALLNLVTSGLFKDMYITRMSERKLSYMSGSIAQTFDHDGINFNFAMTSTHDIAKGLNVLEELLAGVTDPSNMKDLETQYNKNKANFITSFFGSISLNRVRNARILGFSTANNCLEFYQALKELSLEDVIANLNLIDHTKTKIVHFGPKSTPTLSGFTEVDEAELLQAWQS